MIGAGRGSPRVITMVFTLRLYEAVLPQWCNFRASRPPQTLDRCKSAKDQMSKGKSFIYQWVDVSIVGCCSLFVVCWLWVVGYWLLVLSFG